MKDLHNYSLLAHNTFGIEARCSRFLEYATEAEARQVACMLRQQEAPCLIVGGGSNLLLTRDFPGIVVHSAVRGISIMQQTDTDALLCCGSGESWDDVVDYSLKAALYGAENLSLIPGDVGASAVQNIGAYGVEVKDLIHEVQAVEIATGELRTITAAHCRYGYRDSRFKHDWKNRYLITHVTYRLSRRFVPHLDYGNIRSALQQQGIDSPTAQQLRQVIIAIRQDKLPDPKDTGNAGSFFMNPVVSREQYERLAAQYPAMPHYTVDDAYEKIPAGWMIEQCGWKGRALGPAAVHDRQALVLVNRGGATGQDILHLCQAIQHDVQQRFGIDIHPEVNIL